MEKANEDCDKLWPLYFKFMAVNGNFVISAIVSVILCVKITGHFDGNLVEHPYRVRYSIHEDNSITGQYELNFR